MDIKQQVAEQRTELEQAVARALKLASAKSDAAEVAITKSTGLSVSTRMGEVENVEFNSMVRWALPFTEVNAKAVLPRLI